MVAVAQQRPNEGRSHTRPAALHPHTWEATWMVAMVGEWFAQRMRIVGGTTPVSARTAMMANAPRSSCDSYHDGHVDLTVPSSLAT